tara:strand:- start:297 stop:506 length:210 start_codon:yes stop_codon:yes gene_type:complete
MKDKLVDPRQNGIAAISVNIIQDIKVNKKADKTSTSLFLFLNVNEILSPVKRQTIEINEKTAQSVPRVR